MNQKLPRYQLFYEGEWHNPTSGEWMETDNPFTQKPWALIPKANSKDVDLAVKSAHQAFVAGEWAEMHPSERGRLLLKFANLLEKHAEDLARIEVADNGKLITEMAAQLKYIPHWYQYFGGMCDKIQGSVLPIDKKDTFNFTRYEPLGVVAAITPWNSPLLTATWKIAPALAAGNTVVLKPSEFTSASAFEFAKLVEECGFPKGVINILSGLGSEIGDALVTHPLVSKVAFTGGTETGKRVYQNAAKGIKKVSLELGGKSPNIVFEDCILENAVKGVISGIFAASGQTCIAGSRLLVQDSIHDQFVEAIVDFAKKAQMGDPQSAATQIGPVTTIPQYEKILSYMEIASKEGAKAVLGGSKGTRPECGEGRFIEPTIYTGVNNKMRIAQEEVFGPVLSVIPFKDEEEAIAIANDSQFGLASGVWSQDVGRMLRMSEKLKSGTVWVNTYRMFSYMSPFGGYKLSGLGREGGMHAIYDYLQEKSVWLSTQKEVANPFVMRL